MSRVYFSPDLNLEGVSVFINQYLQGIPSDMDYEVVPLKLRGLRFTKLVSIMSNVRHVKPFKDVIETVYIVVYEAESITSSGREGE